MVFFLLGSRACCRSYIRSEFADQFLCPYESAFLSKKEVRHISDGGRVRVGGYNWIRRYISDGSNHANRIYRVITFSPVVCSLL